MDVAQKCLVIVDIHWEAVPGEPGNQHEHQRDREDEHLDGQQMCEPGTYPDYTAGHHELVDNGHRDSLRRTTNGRIVAESVGGPGSRDLGRDAYVACVKDRGSAGTLRHVQSEVLVRRDR